jgi:Cytochrome c
VALGYAIHLAWGSVDDFGDSSSPWRSVQIGEEMLRIWVIAGIALAASNGPTLGQDAAAGEQVFKRLCSPCHEIGQDAKIKLGPPLNGIDGRKSGTFEGFNSGITLEGGNFPQIYPRANPRNPGHPHGICRPQERQGHRRPLGLSQAVRG